MPQRTNSRIAVFAERGAARWRAHVDLRRIGDAATALDVRRGPCGDILNALSALCLLVSLGTANAQSPATLEWILDTAAEDAILALDPDRIPDHRVKEVLAKAPAPHIFSFKGSLAGVSMNSFGEFLVQMGYPADKLRNPRDGSYTYIFKEDFRENSAQVAGTLAWYYEQEGMVPMLVGHSGGGVAVNRVLYDLLKADSEQIPVWNPVKNAVESRNTVRNPVTGVHKRIAELRVPYATMFATGKLLRWFFGQAGDIPRLRTIPDSVEEFTGFQIELDPIAGTSSDPELYALLQPATRLTLIRNVILPPSTSHINAFQVDGLARNAQTRAWIDAYRPDRTNESAPSDVGLDTSNIYHAADIWHSVKKHWCLEAQRLIRARRAVGR